MKKKQNNNNKISLCHFHFVQTALTIKKKWSKNLFEIRFNVTVNFFIDHVMVVPGCDGGN